MKNLQVSKLLGPNTNTFQICYFTLYCHPMKMKVISIHRRLIKPSFLSKFAIPSQEKSTATSLNLNLQPPPPLYFYIRKCLNSKRTNYTKKHHEEIYTSQILSIPLVKHLSNYQALFLDKLDTNVSLGRSACFNHLHFSTLFVLTSYPKVRTQTQYPRQTLE